MSLRRSSRRASCKPQQNVATSPENPLPQKAPPGLRCRFDHRETTLYCESCAQLVCVACLESNKHRAHSIVSAQLADQSLRTSLKELSTAVLHGLPAVVKARNEATQQGKDLDDALERSIAAVERTANALIDGVRAVKVAAVCAMLQVAGKSTHALGAKQDTLVRREACWHTLEKEIAVTSNEQHVCRRGLEVRNLAHELDALETNKSSNKEKEEHEEGEGERPVEEFTSVNKRGYTRMLKELIGDCLPRVSKMFHDALMDDMAAGTAPAVVEELHRKVISLGK